MTLPFGDRPWTDDWQDEDNEPDYEPMDEDSQAEDYNRAVDEIAGLYPKPDQEETPPALRGYDHDSQFMHQYDGWTDRGDQELDPDGYYPF